MRNVHLDPDGRSAGTRVSVDERKVRAMIIEARKKRIPAPPLFSCDPHGNNEVRLETYLRAAEPEFRDQADAAAVDGTEFRYAVGVVDKAQQGVINALAGEAGGTGAIEAYFHVASEATSDVAAINGSEHVGVYLARVGPRSDEGVLAIGAVRLTVEPEVQFKVAWDMRREELDLRGYKYCVEVPIGSAAPSAGSEAINTEVIPLDLNAFSRVLRWPQMVVACNHKISRPMGLEAAETGFLQRQIRQLEDTEAVFFDRIPRVYIGGDGLAEVQTPFRASLASIGKTQAEQGTFVEIKLAMNPEQARDFLPFTKDQRSEDGTLTQRGTRKGHSEIQTGNTGMRFWNTYFGKARTNRILTAIACAMGDLADEGISIMPVAGGYLTYWMDAPDDDNTTRRIEQAIRKRINPRNNDPTDPTYIKLDLKPSIRTFDARGIDIDEVRARFILQALGRREDPVQLLDRTDFLVNFLEHVSLRVQRDIFGSFDRMGRNEGGLAELDLRYLDDIRWICSKTRTIRNTEDLIWTLRNGELPADIGSGGKRQNLETWVFDFAAKYYQKLFHLLTMRAREEMGHSQ